MDCDQCSKTTQQWCSRTGKCWKDHPETTGWADPDDIKQEIRELENFDRVIGWIGGEE